MTTNVSVPCTSCDKPIQSGDDFCEGCGVEVSKELKAALRERMVASNATFAGHHKQLQSAQTTIAAMSVLFVLGGIVYFFITQSQANDALTQLAGAEDSALLAKQVAGATTVGELRAMLEREPYQVLGLNLFLALVMLGLWRWSKQAVFPATVTALGIYVAVIVASALYDPTTIAQGVFIKIVIIAALAKGVQSALAARRLETAG